LKFRIEAPDAYPRISAWIPSTSTFYDPNLRVEEWDVDAGAPVNVYEAVSSFGCMQTALSSRRQDLACVDFKETLVLLGYRYGRSAFERKDVRHGDVALNTGLGSVRYQSTSTF